MSAIMTRLDAVNLALSTVGQAPVSTLGSGANALATMAENILEESNREIQAEGWWFNTEIEITYTPTVDDEIVLGDDIFHADGHDQAVNLTKRGNRLYDLTDHTFTFTDEIDLDVIRYLDWDLLPLLCQNYIAHRAARKLVQRYLNDSSLIQASFAAEQMAAESMTFENARQADNNFLTGNPERFLILNRGGRGALERGLI